MIKAIVFDCFGVLYVHHGRDFTWHHAINAEGENQIKDLNNQADYGLISQEDYVKQIAEILHEDIDVITQEFNKGFSRNEWLVSYIESNLSPKYKVGLLSNIPRDSMDKYFTKEELNKYFDVTVLSGEAGLIKPRPSAFVNICDQLGIDTSETLMIDDNIENCQGAKTAGLEALHYDGFAHLKRSLEAILANTNN
ncbi:MAG: HAD-IA family hydrolase [Candidatus Saccharibacteria bacterium]